MTEATPIDSSAADRLARLQQRRPASSAGPSPADAQSAAARKPRNATPAAGSKAVATGASAMAVLGLVAMFGQRAGSNTTETTADAGAPAVVPDTAQTPVSAVVDSAGLTRLDAEAPNVVVLIDGQDNAVVAVPSKVTGPTRVELAIPAPREVVVTQAAPADPTVVTPQPAEPAAPVPAPAPAATTQGS